MLANARRAPLPLWTIAELHQAGLPLWTGNSNFLLSVPVMLAPGAYLSKASGSYAWLDQAAAHW